MKRRERIRLLADNIVYYFKEAFSSLFRNFWLSMASIGVIIISLFILGSSVLLVLNAREMADQVESSVEISVFLEDEIESQEMDRLGDRLERMDGVTSIQFVSRDEALEEFKESLGEQQGALSGLEEENPLPDMYRIKTEDTSFVPGIAQNVERMQGVEKVRYGHGVVENLIKITAWVRTAGIALMALMGLASIFLIATTIRMSIYSRRNEIEIMKYLGATNFFIRIPFLLEGLFLGILGGLVTSGIIYFGYNMLIQNINASLPFLNLIHSQEVIYYTLGSLLLLGALIGIIGSGISVRRFLKV